MKKKQIILLDVTENQDISVGQIDLINRVGKSTALFILRKPKFHPYKFRSYHGLQPRDELRSRTFCEWYTRNRYVDVKFSHKII